MPATITLRISLPRRKAREFEEEYGPTNWPTDEPEFPQDYEPQEGDYVISSTGHLGEHTYVGIVGGKGLGTFRGPDQEDDAEKAIKADMKRTKFYPQVWFQDDHGGFTKRTIQ
jgi:hypothetical protein